MNPQIMATYDINIYRLINQLRNTSFDIGLNIGLNETPKTIRLYQNIQDLLTKNEIIKEKNIENKVLFIYIIDYIDSQRDNICLNHAGFSNEIIDTFLFNRVKSYWTIDVDEFSNEETVINDIFSYKIEFYKKWEKYNTLASQGWGEKGYKPQVKRSSLPIN